MGGTISCSGRIFNFAVSNGRYCDLFSLLGSVLVPVLTGVVLAYVMQGVINQLQRARIPSRWSMIITYLLFLGGFVGFLLFLMPRIWRQLGSLYNDLPSLSDKLGATLSLLPEQFPC